MDKSRAASADLGSAAATAAVDINQCEPDKTPNEQVTNKLKHYTNRDDNSTMNPIGQQQQPATAAAPPPNKHNKPNNNKSPTASAGPVRSPNNRALIESDPLFQWYLICVGLIAISILAIKCLIPGMPIYSHTVIGFAFLLVIILASTIYTRVKSKKVSIKQLTVISSSSSSYFCPNSSSIWCFVFF